MKFDPANKHLLESSGRKKLLPPEEILNSFEITSDEIVVDVGCGTGFFSIPASYIVEDSGEVIALDVAEEMIKELNGKLEKKEIKNIVAKQCKEYEFSVENGYATFVLLSNVLHEVEDKEKLLAEINRITRRGGRLGVIEWQKKETEKGPPVNIRLSEKDIKNYLKDAGFEVIKLFSKADKFNLFLAKKVGES